MTYTKALSSYISDFRQPKLFMVYLGITVLTLLFGSRENVEGIWLDTLASFDRVVLVAGFLVAVLGLSNALPARFAPRRMYIILPLAIMISFIWTTLSDGYRPHWEYFLQWQLNYQVTYVLLVIWLALLTLSELLWVWLQPEKTTKGPVIIADDSAAGT